MVTKNRIFQILLFAPLVLTACRPSDALRPDSVQTYDASNPDHVRTQKLDLIEAKKRSFVQHVQLNQENPSIDGVVVAFRNDYQLDQKALLEVEAFLPDMKDKFYEAWIENPDTNQSMSIGALEYAGPGNYAVIFTSSQDLNPYTQIYLTVESEADETPEQKIFIGAFPPLEPINNP